MENRAVVNLPNADGHEKNAGSVFSRQPEAATKNTRA